MQDLTDDECVGVYEVHQSIDATVSGMETATASATVWEAIRLSVHRKKAVISEFNHF